MKKKEFPFSLPSFFLPYNPAFFSFPSIIMVDSCMITIEEKENNEKAVFSG
jgi:hypothetical protein